MAFFAAVLPAAMEAASRPFASVQTISAPAARAFSAIHFAVNASPEVARQFDAAALQRMTELVMSHVTLTNPRSIKLTAAAASAAISWTPRPR